MPILPPSAATTQAKGLQLAAPVGGWNCRDALALMPPLDAVFMDNLYPYASGVISRKGSSTFATLPSGQAIKSLHSYQTIAGAAKLFAATASGFYDVTAGGAISAVSSSATNGYWSSVNISTAGGSFLWCCNGVDKSRYFNGVSWTILDTTSTPSLTGVVSNSITSVTSHSTRLFFTVNYALSFFYLPVNSIAGAAAEFPLGALFRKGGYVQACGSWSIDTGRGMDDLFVAVSSEGEVAVYSGYDPSNAATWSLQGIYQIAAPIGRKCIIQLGGDCLVLTVSGLVSLSSLLQSSILSRKPFISDKINPFFQAVLEARGSHQGWEGVLFPEMQMVIINAPLGSSLSWQFVMNNDLKAWARFTDWNADCLGYHSGNPYYAIGNKVWKAWDGYLDDTAAIQVRCKTAFQHITGRSRISRITMLRPIFTSGALVSVNMALDTDYEDGIYTTASTSFFNAVSNWDSAIFDESYWSGSQTVRQWRTVSHTPGKAFALRLRAGLRNTQINWTATDFIHTPGGLR